MEVFAHAGMQMLILCVLVLLGVVARKKHLMNDDFDALLSRLVMTITLPGMILDSVLGNSDMPDADTIWLMVGGSAIIYVGLCVFALVCSRVLYRGVPKAAQGAHAYIIAFGNTGFIGFAVLDAIMGSNAVLYAALYNISFNLFMFTIGPLFVASGADASSRACTEGRAEQVKRIAKQLLSPCVVSCLAAMVLALLGITDEGFFGQACELVGQMTVPAAMLVIGSTLAKMPVREMVNDPWSYLTTALRLGVAPLLIYLIGGLLVQDPYLLAVMVLESAMPAASVGTMMCLAYGGDTRTMLRGTFLTTVLSLISLPLLAMLVVP